MTTRRLQERWDAFAREDPKWAVLTQPDMKGRKWSDESFFATGEADVREAFETLGRLGIAPPNRSALDFGCGVGRLTAALAGRFAHVDGVDFSKEMLAEAGRIRDWPVHVRFVHCADSGLRALASESYDLVLSLLTLQHIPERTALAYVGSLHRVLKPGGTAFLQMATFLDTASPGADAKLARDESRLNRLYRGARSKLAPPRTAMSTFYCRLSETLHVLERRRARLVAVLPGSPMGGAFVSHTLIFQKPAHGAPAHSS